MPDIVPLSIAVEPHHRRIRRVGIGMLPLMVVFYVVGVVWAYTRILLCSGLESVFACEYAIAIPLALWALMVLGVSLVVLDLRALGGRTAAAVGRIHPGPRALTMLTHSRVRYGLHALHPSHRVHVHNSLRGLVYAGGAIATYYTFLWQLGDLESGAWFVQVGAIAGTELAIWALSSAEQEEEDEQPRPDESAS